MSGPFIIIAAIGANVLVFVVLYFVIKLAVRNGILDAHYGRGASPYTVDQAIAKAVAAGIAESQTAAPGDGPPRAPGLS